jgi:hypothetical protein
MRAWWRALLAVGALSACQAHEDASPCAERDRAAIAEPGCAAALVEQGPAGAPRSVGPSAAAWPPPVMARDAGPPR